jgi:hypothetical protein
LTKRAWDGVSAADRTKAMDIAAGVEKQLQADVPKQDALAVTLMGSQGLKVSKATGPEWQQLADALAKNMRGEMVPHDIFDLAVKERDAFRQRKGVTSSK